MTDISETQPGDVAVLFNQGLTANERTERIGPIPRELLTNLSEWVKRVFVSK